MKLTFGSHVQGYSQRARTTDTSACELIREMKLLALFAAFAVSVQLAPAQSPSAQTSLTIGGKSITIHYSAPSVRHRKIFGPGGLLSQDPTYPAWRAGANSATSFHTDGDLDIGGLSVPKGDYTVYVWVADPDNWQLVLNKQTGQWGSSTTRRWTSVA